MKIITQLDSKFLLRKFRCICEDCTIKKNQRAWLIYDLLIILLRYKIVSICYALDNRSETLVKTPMQCSTRLNEDSDGR